MLNHTQDVKTVLFHPHVDLLASASYDDTIHLSSDAPLADWEPFQTLGGHAGTVWTLAFEPARGDWLASAGDEGEIRFWQRRSVTLADRHCGRRLLSL
jgi:WD40 repeat protein